MTRKEDDRRPLPSPAEILRIEAEAERRNAALVEGSLQNLGDRCPDCGSLGSLELIDGRARCVDCDLEILERAQLPGLGKA